MNNKRHKIYEGKSKILFESFDSDFIIQHFKDKFATDDSHVSIDGDGMVNNKISAFLMDCLNGLGIKTHFIKYINMREQAITRLSMIPIDVVVRNFMSNDLKRRVGFIDSDKLIHPIIEFYHKNRSSLDLLINDDHILCADILNAWELDEIRRITLRINDVLSGIFIAFGIRVIDFKMEYGKEYNEIDDSFTLVLGDEISADSFSLFDVKTSEIIFDRSLFSNQPPSIESYHNLAERMGIIKKV